MDTRDKGDQVKCACGCGDFLPAPKFPSQVRKFLHGHWAKSDKGRSQLKKRGVSNSEVMQIVEEYVNEMRSLDAIAALHGLTGSGVWGILRRANIRTRTRKDVGPIQGPKRSGDAHWTRRNPPPCKATTYKSVRVIDEDGKSHKRRRHVLIVEATIGRRLFAHECVHHIDGDKHNNDPSNLQLMTRSEHARHEVTLARQKWPHKYIMRRDVKTGRLIKIEAVK